MKNHIKKVCFASLFLSMSLFALDCNNANTTLEQNECAQLDFKKADKELNIVYKKLMKILDEEGKILLKKSQRTWVKFRDLEADFASDVYRGGSLSTQIYINSRIETTKYRVYRLEMALSERTEH